MSRGRSSQEGRPLVASELAQQRDGADTDAAASGRVTCPHCGEHVRVGTHSTTKPFGHSGRQGGAEPLWTGTSGAPDDDQGVDLGGFVTVDEFGDVTLASPDRAAQQTTSSGRLGVLAMVLLAIVGVLVAVALSRSGESADLDSENAPVAVPTIPAEAADPGDDTVGDFGDDAADALTGDAPTDDALLAAIGSWYDEAQVAPHSLVWPVDGGLALLDQQGYRVIDPPIAVGVQEASGLELFSGGERTWGIDPSTPSTLYVVSMNQKIVATDIEQAIAYEREVDGSLQIGVSSFGGWSEGTNLPVGTETLAVPGLGLLVLPETGGTFILKGRNLTRFSDDRIVAGTGQTLVAQRCDEALDCALYVTSVAAVSAADRTDAGILVDVEVGTEVVPAPSGDWVLALARDDSNELVGVTNTTRWPLPTASPLAVSWAKDSSFAAWLTPDALHLAFPDQQRYETIALPDALSAPGLLVASAAQ